MTAARMAALQSLDHAAQQAWRNTNASTAAAHARALARYRELVPVTHDGFPGARMGDADPMAFTLKNPKARLRQFCKGLHQHVKRRVR